MSVSGSSLQAETLTFSAPTDAAIGRTVGVAVPIPEPYLCELQDWRSTFGDPMAEAIPPHITLLPPTVVTEAEHGAVTSHLDAVAEHFPPFRVHLRGTGTFRPVSPVVFVALAEGISACERLSVAVRTGPLAVNLHFPYHPHVTVAHHLSSDALDNAFETLAGYDAAFDVEAFSLYLHGVDGHWRRDSDHKLLGGGFSV
jgi:2'-5' RNA ligase